MAHTTFPVSLGAKPHWSLSAQMMCSPRPVSAREPGARGAGAACLGRRPRTARMARAVAGRAGSAARAAYRRLRGRACRSALVSSSDTTITMSWLRSAVPHRYKVAEVKSRAVRTDPASAPSARVAIRGMPGLPAETGSGDGRQPPFARPAISAASISQRRPGPALRAGRVRWHSRPVNLFVPGGQGAGTWVVPLTGEAILGVFLDHQDPHLYSPASRMPFGGRASSPTRAAHAG